MLLAVLAINRYFDNPAFMNYLQYLKYWKQPQYAKYIVYVLLSVTVSLCVCVCCAAVCGLTTSRNVRDLLPYL